MQAHLVIVHFPIALIVAAAAADLAGVALGDAALRRGAGRLLVAGALGALLAFFTGSGALSAFLAHTPGNPAVEAHAQWGGAGVWGVAGAGLLRLLWRGRFTGPFGWGNLALAVAASALVLAITLSGTAIRHAS